ncbi:TIM barrel protein [Saccharomonospora sp. NPDC046836]|uniref:sugar phosphate isomerase/epimerase family protein n=1 Tax=Saccharomonospora sp. NPDC046836 TaxID=3156921 RepID=UPI0033D38C6B
MIITGLASVTFRGHGVDEIVTLAAQARLGVIEWAADVHVRPGDLAAAEHARTQCTDHGIAIGTYGSYHKAGEDDPRQFDVLVGTAVALGAPRVRVWAGTHGSAEVSTAERRHITDALRRCADLAGDRGVRLTVEHHVQSLTDTLDSALRLYTDLGSGAVAVHWQPRELPDIGECRTEVRALLPELASVHAFSWGSDGFTERLPLGARADLWQAILAELAADEVQRHVSLEFVRDDSPAALAEDAHQLHHWLNELENTCAPNP